MKVLIVDDYAENCNAIIRMLAKFQCDCHTAYSGEKAIEAFEMIRPDLILLDIMMPGMDGYEVARKIREKLGSEWIPIIFLTGKNSDLDQIKGYQVKGDDFISKPVHPIILESKISVMLNIIKMKRQIEEDNQILQQYILKSQRDRIVACGVMEGMINQGDDFYKNGLLDVWMDSVEEFSGDMFLAAQTRSGKINLCLSDATGHGLAAAVIQIPAATAFYEMSDLGYSISYIAEKINQLLRPLGQKGFFLQATLVCIDRLNRHCEIWHGGNQPVLFFDHEGRLFKELPPNHAALGVLENDKFKHSCYQFNLDFPGKMILYSDGVTDSFNLEKEPYTKQRLIQSVLERSGEIEANDIRHNVDAFMQGCKAADDRTLVLHRFDGK